MSTYIAIAAAETDPEAPLTSELAKKWSDNVLAIAECDSSAPATLLPSVLLGTITTTSGTSQTLSSLNLTPYKFLRLVFQGVSNNSASTAVFTVAGINVTPPLTNAATLRGFLEIDLSQGTFFGVLISAGTNSYANDNAVAGDNGITTASTSISVGVLGGASFDAGNILVYGIK